MIHCNKQCWGSGISRAASLLARTWPGCLDHLPTSDASFPLWWETFPRRLLNLHTKRLLLAILQTCLDRLTPSDSRLSGWVSFYHLSNSPLSSSIHQPWKEGRAGGTVDSRQGQQVRKPLPCCVAWDNFISLSGPQNPHPEMRLLDKISSSYSSLCIWITWGSFYKMQVPRLHPEIHFE